MPDYLAIVRQMKQRYHLRIHKWRRQMSGCAWCVKYSDGRKVNWIESPRPKTPISLAIFLHEVGHHVIGFGGELSHSEEEYRAWKWAIDTMAHFGVATDARVARRMELSMRYAVSKEVRRGAARHLPSLLHRYLPRAA